MLFFIFPDLRKRSDKKEIMDDGSADLKKLLRTVRQFRMLNFLFSSSRRLIRKHFFSIMKKAPELEYSMLDLGAGGCDIDRWAVREARRLGIRLNITALDNDGRILPAVCRSLERYPEIRLVHFSALDLNEDDRYDFIFSNHFLHHLGRDEIEKVLKYASSSARIGFLFNDIRRTMSAFIFYTLFTGIFLHRSFAYYDGRLSIRRGFRRDELRGFLDNKQPEQNNIKIEIDNAFPSRICIRGSAINY